MCNSSFSFKLKQIKQVNLFLRHPVQFFLFFPARLRQEKNTNEQRVITDYMQDISKFCRLWLSKTAKVINSH
jgi:hypothetical protein